jgi:UDP-N-acetylmuramoyl-L-alanyl-D-glutamate--2,6-diaminopimelate ligase
MLESRPPRAPGESSGSWFALGDGASQLAMEPISPTPAAGMPLAELVPSFPRAEVRGSTGVAVHDLAYRSSDVVPGSVFFCVPGGRTDGHLFASDACMAGAAACVVERWLDIGCTQILVPSTRHAMGPVSAAFFGHPADRLTVVGVTGTNGKTTTTYLLESIFRAAGLTPGVIGTTGVRVAGRPEPFDRTTPEAPDLQRLLARMAGQGVKAVAMEASSHGLDQHRVDGIRYACAVFTNLSLDHLDYHGSMEEYFVAKARLFTPALAELGAVNGDSPEGRRLVEAAVIPTLTFGLEPDADVRATRAELSPSGLTFEANGMTLRSRLRGAFNVYNCLAAITAARQVEIEDAAIVRGVADLLGVPGRLEPIEAGQPFEVLVDYAHTPDSLDNALKAVRQFTPRRVLVAFGCGGDRDRGKRSLMGEVASRLADLTIVTSDNPRSENPEAIIGQIVSGARRGGGRFEVEPDRRLAIRRALDSAQPGDSVLIAGKGHETGQQFGDHTVPFDDRLVAAEELREISRGRP